MKKTLFKGIMALGLAGAFTAPLVAADAAPTSKKAWTFMVFLNADNNLDRFGVEDIQEMARVGSNEDANVIVQIDRAYGKPAQRLYIKNGSYDVLEDMGEVDMGSVDVYTDFVKWGAENYPADHYAVIMWNHGSGWTKKPGTEIRGISYDDQSHNHITTNQLTEAHAKIQDILGKKLDVLAFDACLMQMVEVAYAVKDNVEIMLASEEVEPGEGWAYVEALQALQKGGSAEEFSTEVVDTYITSYMNGSQGNRQATQAWVYPAKIDGVVTTLNALAADLMGTHTEEIKSAISKVQRFYERSNADLVHFLELLDAQVSDADLKAKIAAAVAAVKEFVGHSNNTGGRMANANGTAIYLPTRGWSFSDKYLNLEWAKATQWDEFLQAHFAASNTMAEDLENMEE